jgi:hypothetical protein
VVRENNKINNNEDNNNTNALPPTARFISNSTTKSTAP